MSVFLKRKSVRNYDSNYKIPREELNQILKIALKAPTNMNLQPNRFLVVESKEAKAKIRNSMYGNLLQLDTSSAFIIIATDLNKYHNSNQIFDEALEQGIMPKEVASKQKSILNMLKQNYNETEVLRDGYLDAGLVAMQLMLVAKDYGYDTCPIAGFNKATILSDLGINDETLKPVLIISIGKAKENGYESHRYNLEKVTKYY